MILNCIPVFGLPGSFSTASTFHNRRLSIDAQAMCLLSGNATTHETTPELGGFLRVLRSLGVEEGPERPSWRTSQTSTVPLRLPAYIWPPSADQHADKHQGGVFSFIQSLPTPVPGVLTLLSQRITWPSIDAVNKISGENFILKVSGSSKGGAFLEGAIEPKLGRGGCWGGGTASPFGVVWDLFGGAPPCVCVCVLFSGSSKRSSKDPSD